MSNSIPSVSIIVVLYNSAETIRRCLEGVASQTFTDFELVLVDNASPDRELDGVTLPERTRVIRNASNLGFAVANNRAARTCQGRWLALLNPDAVPEPDWLEQLVAAAKRHGAASTGSLQIKGDAPDLLDGAGDVCHVSGIAWRAGFGRPLDFAPEEDCEIFGACAAAVLYDREQFEAVGGFYERFFCYYEDVDIALRMRLNGQRAVLAPRARVAHLGSASSGGRHSDFAVFHGFRNTIWAFAKNMPLRILPYALPMHVTMIAMVLVLNARRPTLKPAFRGLVAALKGLPDVLRDRKALQASAAPDADLFLHYGPFAGFHRPLKARKLEAGTEREAADS